MTMALDDIIVGRCSPDAPNAVRLIDKAEAELALRYPKEHRHGRAAEALLAQQARFFVATHDGKAAGCGGYVRFADGSAELVRMFVAPRHRGHGIARAILDAIEQEAAGEGVTMMMLETGTLQSEALALYRDVGYRVRGPFGSYSESPVSVFMEKHL